MTEQLKVNRYVLAQLSPEQRSQLLHQRAQDNLQDVEATVRQVLAAVRSEGDAALVRLTRQYDGAELSQDQLRVSEEEFDHADKLVEDNLRAALVQAIQNVRNHHQFQLPPPSWMTEIAPGVLAGERTTPIASVGLYVPRGKGSFPSVMIMLCIPAVIAGVPEIVVCTPPGADGSVDPASLVAARLCGVENIVKVGGAQAIAAMAYGTGSVPKVDKILGPGNQYVTAARRILSSVVDPGPPAGPSESVILCDAAADVEIAARELLVEAEHGEDSAVLLVTHSSTLAAGVVDRLTDLVDSLPENRARNCKAVLSHYGGIVLTEGLHDSVVFVNEYAPEHLRVLVDNPFELLPAITHAGEVLLGENTSIAFGNFSIGVNAILPTGRNARTYSCMGVGELLKRSSFAYVSPAGVRSVGPTAVELARYEGFPAHAAAAQYIVGRVETASDGS
ncbi:MAG: histidinol dehydrogenase [Pseudonocardiaceae bacterium]